MRKWYVSYQGHCWGLKRHWMVPWMDFTFYNKFSGTEYIEEYSTNQMHNYTIHIQWLPGEVFFGVFLFPQPFHFAQTTMNAFFQPQHRYCPPSVMPPKISVLTPHLGLCCRYPLGQCEKKYPNLYHSVAIENNRANIDKACSISRSYMLCALNVLERLHSHTSQLLRNINE